MKFRYLLRTIEVFALVTAFMTVGTSRQAQAIEAIYVGGQLGYVKLTGDYSAPYSDALGFGVDLGFRNAGLVDMNLGYQLSDHSGNGGLTNHRATLSADIHIGNVYDFDFTVGAGPGLYIFKGTTDSITKFGLNFGGAVDVHVDDHLRVGLGLRYHAVLGSNAQVGSLWSLMMRVGYLFDL